MAINRDVFNEERERSQQNRGASSVNFIGEGTYHHRVLEFTDPRGVVRFARKVVMWGRLGAGGKRQTVCVDRLATWGIDDAFTKAEELAGQHGHDWPYERRASYYVNAIDLNNRGGWRVERWQYPFTVWEAIGNMAADPNWADILEPEGGHAFAIVGKGKMLAREYTVTVDRHATPVPVELLPQICDPWAAIQDPGIEGQLRLLNMAVEDLWPNGWQEIEHVQPLVFQQPEPAPLRQQQAPPRQQGGPPPQQQYPQQSRQQAPVGGSGFFRAPPQQGQQPSPGTGGHYVPPVSQPVASDGPPAGSPPPTAGRAGPGPSQTPSASPAAAGNKPRGSLLAGLVRPG